MVSGALWNIVLGIFGGIISGVIVSRVFLLQSKVQNNIDLLESGLRKLNYLQGIIYSLKVVMELDYDTELDKQKQMQLKGYTSENEYYASKKNARWIDAVELKNSLIKWANDEAEKIYDELRNLEVKGKEASEIMNTYSTYVSKIKSMQEAPFSLITEASRLYNLAIAQFEEYKRNSKKELLKEIFTDKTMICLYVLTLVIIVAAGITGVFGV